MFFGREDVFSFVRRNLIGQHRDSPIVLYGQRRTGKTSVLYQLHRHLDPRYRCIFIDLHGLSLDGEANLMWGIANSIGRGLQRDHQIRVGIPDRATFFADPLSVFETVFLDAVWSVLGEDHLVLMLDEVARFYEEVRAGRLERQVFDYLRHLMQHFERLNFIFSLGSGLEEMEKDYAFLFSVTLYRRISFLEPAAARALITQPIRDYYQVMPDALEKILQVTSGHPYYTQLVCHCLFDRWSRSLKPTMTAVDVDAVLTEAIELGSANLTYVWEDSTREERAVMAGMAAAMGGRCHPVTVDDVRNAWQRFGVGLPEGDVARAVRSLVGRDVVADNEVVAGERSYSFAVDLQRLWLEKHRRLDWVKEDLEVREWDRSAEAGPDASIAELPREPEQGSIEGAASGRREELERQLVGESVAGDIEHERHQRSPRALLAAASILAVVIIAGSVIAVLHYGQLAIVVALLVVLLAGLISIRSIRIIPQAKVGIVERFGRYYRTLYPGFNVVVPFADRLRPLIDLRQQVVSYPPQQVLTKDNVMVGIDTVIYFHVIDVKAAVYAHVNFIFALQELMVGRLRTVVSSMDLENTLASRDQINNELKRELKEAMAESGIQVDRVELKAIEPLPPGQGSA
jgi:SPFH domain / Band 7 family